MSLHQAISASLLLRGGGKVSIPRIRPPCEEQEASSGLEPDTQSRPVGG